MTMSDDQSDDIVSCGVAKTFICTRERGHDGPHKAHLPNGSVVDKWDNSNE